MVFKHNTSRVEAFSDAVFAFAATLLVITVGYEESSSVIKIDWLLFISFGVSFFVLVAFWWLHYNFFRRTDYIDNVIIALNTILLFVVLYYVFPLKSLVNSMAGKQPLTIEGFSSLFQLYSLGFLLIFICFALMYFRAYKQTKANTQNIDLLFYARHFGIYVLIAFLSIILAKFQIGLSFALPGLIYILLGPLCYIHGINFNKKHKI